jgi:hypothetical protein
MVLDNHGLGNPRLQHGAPTRLSRRRLTLEAN